MRKVNKKLSIFVIAMLLMLGIGFAAITTTLNITGNTSITGDTTNFQNNVFFASASLTATGLKTEDNSSAQPKINGRELTFTIPSTSSSKTIGDKIEVDYTIRNESNYKALIEIPTVKSPSTDFLDYFTVTHSRNDSLELGVNQTTPTQKLTLTLKKTYADINVKNISFKIEINATAIDATTNGVNNGNGITQQLITKISGDGTHIGDEIAIGNEHFYVIGIEGGNTKLLSRYNLLVGNIDGEPMKNPTGIQDPTALGFKEDVEPYIGTVPFSKIDYWEDIELKLKYGTDYPAYVYDSNASIKKYVDDYKTYLEEQGAVISEARLISHEELANLGCDAEEYSCSEAPSWAYFTTYWTGSAAGGDDVLYVRSDGNIGVNENGVYWDIGVRPVIIIDSSLI